MANQRAKAWTLEAGWRFNYESQYWLDSDAAVYLDSCTTWCISSRQSAKKIQLIQQTLLYDHGRLSCRGTSPSYACGTSSASECLYQNPHRRTQWDHLSILAEDLTTKKRNVDRAEDMQLVFAIFAACFFLVNDVHYHWLLQVMTISTKAPITNSQLKHSVQSRRPPASYL